MSYQPGSLKQDPDTRAVAVRTSIPDAEKSWGVMTLDRGGHYASEDEVADWLDVG